MSSWARMVRRQYRATRRYVGKRAYADLPISRRPAFDDETFEWFSSRIGSCRAYLEFGAGASSLLAADAGVPTVSIESDGAYAAKVRQALPPQASSQVVHVDIGRTEDWGKPVWTIPTGRTKRRWRRYPDTGVELIASLPQFPDLVLVDGRFRRACALSVAQAALARGATTQILFDDYRTRHHHSSIEQILGPPTSIGRAGLFEIGAAPLDADALAQAIGSATSDYS